MAVFFPCQPTNHVPKLQIHLVGVYSSILAVASVFLAVLGMTVLRDVVPNGRCITCYE
jgi:hypothetical protein